MIGHGAYTSGTISLSYNANLYAYIGQQGVATNTQTFNGNLAPQNNFTTFYAAGGGATDIRTISGAWNNEDSLRSRVIVAGAGGGAGGLRGDTYKGGDAGGLTGYSSTVPTTEGPNNTTSGDSTAYGANQTAGGKHGMWGGGYGDDGAFGIGGRANTTMTIVNSTDGNTGRIGGSGGGGWYGGGAGPLCTGNCSFPGSGGSSYISGHTGSVAVTSKTSSSPKSGCTTGTTTNSCSVSPYGYTFSSTLMIDGAGYKWTNSKGSRQVMPNPSGGNYASGVGHSGNGYARITYLGT